MSSHAPTSHPPAPAPDGPGRYRLFFALVPPAPVRAGMAALAGRLRDEGRIRGCWVRPARYHLTLALLGEFAVPPAATLVRDARAAAAALRLRAFDWQADRLMGFPGRRPPCVLGAADACAPLEALRATLRHALARHAVPVVEDHPFVPHVTLAYAEALLAPACAVPPLRWPVRSLVLLQAESGVSAYDSLGEWSLAG